MLHRQILHYNLRYALLTLANTTKTITITGVAHIQVVLIIFIVMLIQVQ